jgi:sugar phosphate isomerase/epimerase
MTISRRELIQFLSVAPLAAAEPRNKVTVNAHVWVFAARQPGYDPTPVADRIFREYGAAGIDGIELMHHMLLKEDSVSRLSELSKRYALPVLGTSWSANMWRSEESDRILTEGRTLISRLSQVGGRTLGISVGDAGHSKTDAEFDAQARVLIEIVKICADHGVVPNLHNHIYEVRDGEHDLKGTLARVPGMKLGPDLNWLVRANVDPVDFISRYRDRMVFAHLRDQKRDGKWCEAMGEGDTDYAAIGRMLHKIDFTGDLVIELAHERDFTPTRSYGESVRISREYVRRVMNY